jgi:hypothetical protein
MGSIIASATGSQQKLPAVTNEPSVPPGAISLTNRLDIGTWNNGSRSADHGDR